MNSYAIFEQLLEDRNITAYRVSMETGVSTATISQWKRGAYVPKVDKLKRIADYLLVPLDVFFPEKDAEDTVRYEIIKEIADQKHMSIAEVERRAGLSNGSIGKWLDSKNGAKVESIMRVADVLGINIMDFFKEEKPTETTLDKDDLPHKILQDIALAYQDGFSFSDVEHIMVDVIRKAKNMRLTLPIEDDND